MAKKPHLTPEERALLAKLGSIGGKARMKQLSEDEQKELARAAGRASGEARRAKAGKKKKEKST